MKAFLLSVLMMLAAVAPVRAAGGTPAGYITDLALTGADAAAKTVVVRDGAEIPARLMMPLFAGDVVFIREPASAVGVETGKGEVVTLGADLRRYTVEGQLDTGDSTWSIISAISDVFAGEGDQAPENMVSKGNDLKMPMVVRGTNLIGPDRTHLWLGWEGGAAPYAVGFSANGGDEKVLATGIMDQSTVIELPDEADGRFTLAIYDSRLFAVKVKVKRATIVPVPQDGEGFRNIAAAAKLSGKGKGEWLLEAAQMLQDEKSGAAAALLAKFKSGWRFGG